MDVPPVFASRGETHPKLKLFGLVATNLIQLTQKKNALDSSLSVIHLAAELVQRTVMVFDESLMSLHQAVSKQFIIH